MKNSRDRARIFCHPMPPRFFENRIALRCCGRRLLQLGRSLCRFTCCILLTCRVVVLLWFSVSSVLLPPVPPPKYRRKQGSIVNANDRDRFSFLPVPTCQLCRRTNQNKKGERLMLCVFEDAVIFFPRLRLSIFTVKLGMFCLSLPQDTRRVFAPPCSLEPSLTRIFVACPGAVCVGRLPNDD